MKINDNDILLLQQINDNPFTRMDKIYKMYNLTPRNIFIRIKRNIDNKFIYVNKVKQCNELYLSEKGKKLLKLLTK